MAASLATHLQMHDPFSPKTVHYSPTETYALLDLLSVDILIDSKAPPPVETSLLNDLLSVDLEFARADVRTHHNVATAPELSADKALFLDLLKVDQQVDNAHGRNNEGGEQHCATSKALHDPYQKTEYTSISAESGMYTSTIAASARDSRSETNQLRDNTIMMHLLAMDESVDDSKRYHKLIESNESDIIGELYMLDKQVSGAKRKVTLVQDLQGLLDVDHLVDGVKKGGATAGSGSSGGGEKRSIFSVKEKYTAKLTWKDAVALLGAHSC